MATQKTISAHKLQMEKALEFLHSEFKSLRTGRASTGLVENVMVDYYGTATPLRQIASLSTPEATTIVIKPFDVSSVKDIEKSIRNSDLSLAPISDGKIIRLNIPPLSQERRTHLIAQAKQMGEQAKVSIRNIRRDANKKLDDEQKTKAITEDDRDKAKKDIDELTKRFSDEIDKAVKIKSDEIMQD